MWQFVAERPILLRAVLTKCHMLKVFDGSIGEMPPITDEPSELFARITANRLTLLEQGANWGIYKQLANFNQKNLFNYVI